ncbi:MAG TPA: 2-C-methyl-D-erythritol 4-phosphate cytidylyltransferase [Bacteroidales bacterium]|nr:2-C-methyl-D-erythritol 4-phosphate cytidylyltransferase [Bacteroidales bacterium]
MKKIALIVAGGTGKRLSTDLPKQFIEICGKPVIIHTLEAFLNPLPDIEFVIVINPKMRDSWDAILSGYHIKNWILAEGGPERFHSVRNGLAKISDDDTVVAIHDAVRPCVSAVVILQAFKDAEYYGNAVPALNITDSVRIKDGPLNEPVDRKRLFKIQTPQCFRIRLIKKAYLQNYDERFTDDAIVLESTGETIHLIEGNAENIKITYPSDLLVAEAFLSKRPV